jgi:hypothetical protein
MKVTVFGAGSIGGHLAMRLHRYLRAHRSRLAAFVKRRAPWHPFQTVDSQIPQMATAPNHLQRAIY